MKASNVFLDFGTPYTRVSLLSKAQSQFRRQQISQLAQLETRTKSIKLTDTVAKRYLTTTQLNQSLLYQQQKLDFKYQKISGKLLEQIMNQLISGKVEELDLFAAAIEPDHLILLSEKLFQHKTLRIIDVGQVFLPEHHFIKFLDVFSNGLSCPKLIQELCVSKQQYFSLTVCEKIVEILGNNNARHLQLVDLHDNHIGNLGFSQIVKHLDQVSQSSFAPRRKIRLNFQHNQISSASISGYVQYLSNLCQSQEVWLIVSCDLRFNKINDMLLQKIKDLEYKLYLKVQRLEETEKLTLDGEKHRLFKDFNPDEDFCSAVSSPFKKRLVQEKQVLLSQGPLGCAPVPDFMFRSPILKQQQEQLHKQQHSISIVANQQVLKNNMESYLQDLETKKQQHMIDLQYKEQAAQLVSEQELIRQQMQELQVERQKINQERMQLADLQTQHVQQNQIEQSQIHQTRIADLQYQVDNLMQSIRPKNFGDYLENRQTFHPSQDQVVQNINFDRTDLHINLVPAQIAEAHQYVSSRQSQFPQPIIPLQVAIQPDNPGFGGIIQVNQNVQPDPFNFDVQQASKFQEIPNFQDLRRGSALLPPIALPGTQTAENILRACDAAEGLKVEGSLTERLGEEQPQVPFQRQEYVQDSREEYGAQVVNGYQKQYVTQGYQGADEQVEVLNEDLQTPMNVFQEMRGAGNEVYVTPQILKEQEEFQELMTADITIKRSQVQRTKAKTELNRVIGELEAPSPIKNQDQAAIQFVEQVQEKAEAVPKTERDLVKEMRDASTYAVTEQQIVERVVYQESPKPETAEFIIQTDTQAEQEVDLGPLLNLFPDIGSLAGDLNQAQQVRLLRAQINKLRQKSEAVEGVGGSDQQARIQQLGEENVARQREIEQLQQNIAENAEAQQLLLAGAQQIANQLRSQGFKVAEPGASAESSFVALLVDMYQVIQRCKQVKQRGEDNE